MTRAVLVCLLLASAAACGKYGPPVRAGAEAPPKQQPNIQVPLPQVTPAPAPAGSAPEPKVEEEPPPEGAP